MGIDEYLFPIRKKTAFQLTLEESESYDWRIDLKTSSTFRQYTYSPFDLKYLENWPVVKSSVFDESDGKGNYFPIFLVPLSIK